MQEKVEYSKYQKPSIDDQIIKWPSEKVQTDKQ